MPEREGMFTGIIEGLGEVISFERTGDGGRLVLRIEFAGELEEGESVAVNGCCLTATGIDAEKGTVRFDLLGETLRVTSLGALGVGSGVNLERALRAGDRMSGHIVQGHIDCVAEVLSFEKKGEDHRLEVVLPEGFSQYVVPKGSIAIDGISLTVAEITETSFSVWIIPHTFEVTNLGKRGAGDGVNLEFDVLAKYAERAREAGGIK